MKISVRDTCLFSCLVLCMLLAIPMDAVLANDRPNILLIVSEDNGQELGCYGEPFVQTPVLDRLAQEGVRFRNAYVPQAGCSQSRAAYLTGLYPHQNGQIGLATWKFRMYRAETPNIVRSLKQAGYRTGIIGKLHVNPASAFPFDVNKIPSANFGRSKLGEYAKQASVFFSSSKKPFFLSINYPDAHRPFIKQVAGRPKFLLTGKDVKPLRYFGIDAPELRNETADYYNCMSRLDAMVGDLLVALQQSGKASNTLVVYLGDHGADMLRGKRTSYEGGLRVPLIVRWPGQIKSKQVRGELVSTIDLMPTLLQVAGAKSEKGLPGKSLLPLLNGKSPAWRQELFTEFHLHSAHNFFPQRTVRNKRYKLIHNLLAGQVNPGYAFTMNRFFPDVSISLESAPEYVRKAYMRMHKPPEFELYDLQKDQYEFYNITDKVEHAQILKMMKKQLHEWRVRTKDPLLNTNNLNQLKAEVDACFVNGQAKKDRLKLNYTEYFFK
jgi:N-sulfoglucosamine sulfohydrolase